MVDDTDTSGEEEVAQLRDQLAAAHREVDRLREEAASEQIAGSALGAEVQAARDEAAARTSAIAELNERLAAVEARETAGAARYRDLLLQSEPTLPADLIAGASVEAIDGAAEVARATIHRVRAHLEAQAQAARVPAGAPQRRAPDLASLSPQEKIRYGLMQGA